MSLQAQQQTLSFVVRLWIEPRSPAGRPVYRGQIEHIASGEKNHFQVPAALLDWLADNLLFDTGKTVLQMEGSINDLS